MSDYRKKRLEGFRTAAYNTVAGRFYRTSKGEIIVAGLIGVLFIPLGIRGGAADRSYIGTGIFPNNTNYPEKGRGAKREIEAELPRLTETLIYSMQTAAT